MSRLSRVEFREAIRRGWSKHCPHCGKGALFVGWNKPHRHCPVCGYLYERDYGDVWWVWIVTDRIPIGIGIVSHTLDIADGQSGSQSREPAQ